MMRYLSPLRYPGGKSWLRRDFCRWVCSLPRRPTKLIEPFAGGASIGLYSVDVGIVESLQLVELDPAIATFWDVVFGPDCAQLLDRVIRFEPSECAARQILESSCETRVDKAFQLLLRNRTNFGGILARGASSLRRGENERGLLSRWNGETLAERLCVLMEFRDRVTVTQGDGLEVLRSEQGQGIVAFVDPPYFGTKRAAGKRLYDFNEVDPTLVFSACQEFGGPFLLTHEADPSIRRLAEYYGLETVEVERKGRSHHAQREYLIARSVSWRD